MFIQVPSFRFLPNQLSSPHYKIFYRVYNHRKFVQLYAIMMQLNMIMMSHNYPRLFI
jgi:hypothetical protein